MSSSTALDAYLHLLPASSSSSAFPLPEALSTLHAASRPTHKAGETRLFYVDGKVHATVALGKGADEDEAVRVAVGKGVKALREGGANGVVEIAGLEGKKAHAAATAANLALWKYLALKTAHGTPALKDQLKEDANKLTVRAAASKEGGAKAGELDWETGKVYAEAQNWSRETTDMPANLCTPQIFCDRAEALFKDVPGVKIYVRDEAWAKEKGMHSFLSVTAGTEVPAKFLEIHYTHPDVKDTDRPVGLVGKGITFDSGGISLKPGAGMKLMRGDMSGASSQVAATYAIARLGLRTRLITCTPLAENMPSGHATKPGDVVYAMNGKSIEVDNTDAEGRLVLADALFYLSSVYNPTVLIDSATLTGATVIALGETYSAAYCSDDGLWDALDKAGKREADPLWRMPLDDSYLQKMRGTNADFCNIGGKDGGANIAAAFLREFVHGLTGEESERTDIKWAHLDIAGSMEALAEGPYQLKGMTGRSVRTVVEYVRELSAN